MPDDSFEELAAIIEILRQKMISCALKNGLNSEKTLKISQLLDIHLTKYQGMKQQVRS